MPVLLCSNGKVQISEEDVEFCALHSWTIGKHGYARTSINMRPVDLQVLIGRRMGLETRFGRVIDHKNRDKSNYRRSNLRSVTRRQSQLNKDIQSNNTSGYIGVAWFERDKCWRAYFNVVGGKRKHLGYFDCPIKAARHRDFVAKKIDGEFAVLNFQEE